MNIRGFRRAAPVLLVVAIGACSAPDSTVIPEPAQDAKLSAPQAKPLNQRRTKSLLRENILVQTVGPELLDWNFAVLHRSDGTMIGRRSRLDIVTTGEGVWLVDDAGHYCRQWNNGWEGGQPACFSISKAEDQVILSEVGTTDPDREVYALVPPN